jgi:hypothetical protein
MSNSGLRRKNRSITRQWKEVYFVILCIRDFSIPTFDLANEYIHSKINHLIIMPVQLIKRSTIQENEICSLPGTCTFPIYQNFPS